MIFRTVPTVVDFGFRTVPTVVDFDFRTVPTVVNFDFRTVPTVVEFVFHFIIRFRMLITWFVLDTLIFLKLYYFVLGNL